MPEKESLHKYCMVSPLLTPLTSGEHWQVVSAFPRDKSQRTPGLYCNSRVTHPVAHQVSVHFAFAIRDSEKLFWTHCHQRLNSSLH